MMKKELFFLAILDHQPNVLGCQPMQQLRVPKYGSKIRVMLLRLTY